jgi:polyhydroxybutyrate depolymerase
VAGRRLARWIFLALGAVLAFAAAALVFVVAPPPPDPGPAPEARTLRVDGRDRTFLVSRVSARPAGAPALLVFPGSGETAGGIRRRLASALDRLAAERGAVVATLQGYGSHFNDCRRVAPYSARAEGVDDVAFTRAVVADLERRDGVDARRIAALGYSNGGHMTFRLALEAPELLTGIVAISANAPDDGNTVCAPVAGRPPTVVLIEGDHDPINPYGGGRVTIFGFGDRGIVRSAEASAQWFAERAGAPGAGPRRVLGSRGGQVAYEMDFGSRVRLVTIAGGGHAIPQAAFRYPRILGATYRGDEVLESALRFAWAP